MKTSRDYIDELKQKLAIKSDYEIAKELGISFQSVSFYRLGKRALDDYTASRIADELGIEPMQIVAAANLEREKCEKKRGYWLKMLERYGAACLLLAVMHSTGLSEESTHEESCRIPIMRSKKRKPKAHAGPTPDGEEIPPTVRQARHHAKDSRPVVRSNRTHGTKMDADRPAALGNKAADHAPTARRDRDRLGRLEILTRGIDAPRNRLQIQTGNANKLQGKHGKTKKT